MKFNESDSHWHLTRLSQDISLEGGSKTQVNCETRCLDKMPPWKAKSHCSQENAQSERNYDLCFYQELRNHPAFMTEIDMNKPLSKETEALIAMQYDGKSECAHCSCRRRSRS